jgi:hypothetical protein
MKKNKDNEQPRIARCLSSCTLARQHYKRMTTMMTHGAFVIFFATKKEEDNDDIDVIVVFFGIEKKQ